jgi:hypothetical protein
MNQFVPMQGASPPVTLSVFKGLQRSRGANGSYPKDDKAAAICTRQSAQMGRKPIFRTFPCIFLQLCRHFNPVYEV